MEIGKGGGAGNILGNVEELRTASKATSGFAMVTVGVKGFAWGLVMFEGK